MNKTISINPELFKVSGTKRSSQKNRNDPNKQIKIRSHSQLKEKTKTFRKNHVLKFIRDQQAKNMQQIRNPDSISDTNSIDQSQSDSFSSDFEESLKFMNNLTTQTKHNQTLKSSIPISNSLLFHPPIECENVCLEMPTDLVKYTAPVGKFPNWGCLKNGTLPTYRNWRNVTQRNTQMPMQPQISHFIGNSDGNNNNNNPIQSTHNINNTPENEEPTKMQILQKIHEMQITPAKTPKIYYPKQQRTVRRTYKVGKLKNQPTVSILVSNKTIRNNTTTKTQLLKQTPMEEVRRVLIKKGFIKVGSSAPNDVLRKMYETTSLICGEIQNHNPDNLLYNFFNDVSK